MRDPNWNHVRIVAVLNLVLGMMHLAILGMIALNLAGGRHVGSPFLTNLVIVLTIVFSVPYIAVGIGLFYQKRWARTVAKFIDPILVIEFPAGSPLGIYAIWLFWFRNTDGVFVNRPKLKVLEKDD